MPCWAKASRRRVKLKYMGSKNRHAKEIIPILMDYYQEGMLYVEPCVGGANMIDKVPVPNSLKIGYDIHHYLIEMWKEVSSGWLPPRTITEEDYKYIKHNQNENPALTGYAGFALSYGGKWWGGYRRDVKGCGDSPTTKRENESNQSRRAYDSLIKQQRNILGISFIEMSIFDIHKIGNKALIYADPPYADSTKYNDDFDHERFYNWCRTMRDQGHVVFVSEYKMPEDFRCVWSKEVNNSLTKNTGGKKGVEKLFILE